MQPLSIKQNTNIPTLDGFTVIELLIVIGIIVIFSVAGIAGYKSFTTRQILVQEARSVRTFLRQAAVDARTGTQPTSGYCSSTSGVSMNGILVTIPVSSQLVTRVDCVNASGVQVSTILAKTYTRSNPSVTFTMIGAIEFYTLSRGAAAGSICIKYGTNTNFYKLAVLTSGEIQDAGIVGSCS